MRIGELPRNRYEGYELIFSYDSAAYYDLRLRGSGAFFSVQLVKTPCPVFHKEFSDKLFEKHWDDPHAYGVWDGERLLAVMEVTPENWNNRLRVTSLCVQEGFRRRGIGALLLVRAKEIGRAQGRRALILETQSCNAGAVAFYLSQGLTLMGFDACAYSNLDAEHHEVRLEMGCLLK